MQHVVRILDSSALLMMTLAGAFLQNQTSRSCLYSRCHSLSRHSACTSSSNSPSLPLPRMPRILSKPSRSTSKPSGPVRMLSAICVSTVRRIPTRSFCPDSSMNEPGEESRLPHSHYSSGAALFNEFPFVLFLYCC